MFLLGNFIAGTKQINDCWLIGVIKTSRAILEVVIVLYVCEFNIYKYILYTRVRYKVKSKAFIQNIYTYL